MGLLKQSERLATKTAQRYLTRVERRVRRPSVDIAVITVTYTVTSQSLTQSHHSHDCDKIKMTV